MNRISEKTEITEANIEEMCTLAEDVMNQLYMNFACFDEDGDDIFEKYCKGNLDYESEIRPLVHKEMEVMNNFPESHLLYDLFRRGDDISDVRYYTLEDIRPWIEPLIPKALQLFRKGSDNFRECNYVAAASVSDDYLIAAFAREVKNMMMIFAGQRMQRHDIPRYLLLLEATSCHDMDEWKGIYFDDSDLKNAYEELVIELEDKRKNDRSYCSVDIAIWQFYPSKEYDNNLLNRQDSNQGKQNIRPVKIEELQCFKE